jgi:protein-disulfide isomerase
MKFSGIAMMVVVVAGLKAGATYERADATHEAASATFVVPLAAQAPSGRALGPVIANVRVDVFSDFQCPACKSLAEQTLRRIKIDYARAGKIRLVHHDFPLPMHLHARRAAVLAAAADRIGKYEEVEAVLFRQQDIWSNNGSVDAAVESVLTPDERTRLHAAAKDPAIGAAIDRDIELGRRMNVRSTPTMIVTKDGKPNPVVGVVSYQIFSRYLDSLLGH